MKATVFKRSVQLMILILLLISFKSGWIYLKNGGVFPISVVKVEADYTHLSPKELQQVISTDLPASFWTVDIRALKSHLKAIVWVQSVRIEKIWPETLKIRVNEKKILARWGKKGLLSNRNEVFYPDVSLVDKNFRGLPILYGPGGQTETVVKQYHTFSQMLKTQKMAIKMLLLSDSGAWIVRLTNGILLLLGKDEPQKRLLRFLRSYNTVFNEERTARRVDLRYPHGMAVSWVVEPVNEKK